MKRVTVLASTLVVMAGPVTALGQGIFASYAFSNYDDRCGLNAPVFDWDGSPLMGTQWRGELYGGATPDSLSPLVNYEDLTREVIGLLQPGYFVSSKSRLCVLSVPAYGTAWLQVKVWDTQLGSTYEEAEARGLGGYGKSALFEAQGGNTLDLYGLPYPLLGLTSFSVLEPIPEPTVRWLAVGGLAGLALARRGTKGRTRPPP